MAGSRFLRVGPRQDPDVAARDDAAASDVGQEAAIRRRVRVELSKLVLEQDGLAAGATRRLFVEVNAPVSQRTENYTIAVR
jgi:hypothetical protein